MKIKYTSFINYDIVLLVLTLVDMVYNVTLFPDDWRSDSMTWVFLGVMYGMYLLIQICLIYFDYQEDKTNIIMFKIFCIIYYLMILVIYIMTGYITILHVVLFFANETLQILMLFSAFSMPRKPKPVNMEPLYKAIPAGDEPKYDEMREKRAKFFEEARIRQEEKRRQEEE